METLKTRKTLARYLAEHLNYKVACTIVTTERLMEVVKEGIEAYESTEGVTVSVVKTDKEMHEECKPFCGVWTHCTSNNLCNYRLEQLKKIGLLGIKKESIKAPADKAVNHVAEVVALVGSMSGSMRCPGHTKPGEVCNICAVEKRDKKASGNS